MKVYSFEIPTSHVVPRPFPYGVQYWVISSTNHPQRGIIYKLGIRVGEVDELLYYWPKAEAVMEDTYTELPKLNPPTGNEQGIIRLLQLPYWGANSP